MYLIVGKRLQKKIKKNSGKYQKVGKRAYATRMNEFFCLKGNSNNRPIVTISGELTNESIQMDG